MRPVDDSSVTVVSLREGVEILSQSHTVTQQTVTLKAVGVYSDEVSSACWHFLLPVVGGNHSTVITRAKMQNPHHRMMLLAKEYVTSSTIVWICVLACAAMLRVLTGCQVNILTCTAFSAPHALSLR